MRSSVTRAAPDRDRRRTGKRRQGVAVTVEDVNPRTDLGDVKRPRPICGLPIEPVADCPLPVASAMSAEGPRCSLQASRARQRASCWPTAARPPSGPRAFRPLPPQSEPGHPRGRAVRAARIRTPTSSRAYLSSGWCQNCPTADSSKADGDPLPVGGDQPQEGIPHPASLRHDPAAGALRRSNRPPSPASPARRPTPGQHHPTTQCAERARRPR